MSLHPPTPESASRLRALFERAKFEPQTLKRVIGANEAASMKKGNQALLLHRTAESTPLNTLLRWFLIGAPVKKARAEATLTSAEMDDLENCGLIEAGDEGFTSSVLVSPYEGFLLAADRLTELESGENAEAVLMVNRTTWRLGEFMLREPVRSTFDLGAGCGALSLLAARHSKEVVATDLNPRAVQFARFNAALNGVTNIECIVGDSWEPVAGRRFDRIISNPPFFISPTSRSMFSDNPFDLDEFCRRLVRQAGEYLEPGGVYQMVFEWAEIEGEPWQDRLTEWVEGTGCDAWIAKGYSLTSDRYAHQRITEKAVDPAQLDEIFGEWQSYFDARGVVAIHGGVLALKRRSGANWIQIGELPAGLADAAEAVRRRLDSLDYAHDSETDEELLQTRPMLSDAAELAQRLRLEDGGWKIVGMQLELRDGLPDKLPADPSVLGMLSALDGKRTLAEIAAAVAQRAERDPGQVAAECARLIRALAIRGFITGPKSTATPAG